MPPLGRLREAPSILAARALFALFALGACGASNTPTTAAPPAASSAAPSTAAPESSLRKPPPEPTPEEIEDEAFLSAHEGGEPFELRFASPSLEGYLSKQRCAYFEWGHGEGRELATYARGYQSEGKVVVVATADGKAFQFTSSTRKLRPYLTPSFDRPAKAGEPWLPGVVADDLARAKAQLWVVEHCLAIGQRYHARVAVETYSLPPRGPGMPPSKGRNRVLQVSDRPFVDGRPQGSITPGFRGWSY